MYDTIVHTMIPPCVLFIFNILVIGSAARQKHKVSPSISVSNTLKKNRRMILQLLAISLMSFITWTHWVVVILVHNFYDPSFAEQFITIAVHYLLYFTSFGSPFVALIGLSEIRKEFKKLVRELRTTLHVIGITKVRKASNMNTANGQRLVD
ncbi:unnamed protein product [Rotaria sp. Silwood2]|nr:unnamed protein product [Rotaria sp. Silwood2]